MVYRHEQKTQDTCNRHDQDGKKQLPDTEIANHIGRLTVFTDKI